jgi:hypothetical protein
MAFRFFLPAAGFAVAAMAATNPSAATFNKDVLPIMQKRCQACHRPGEAAPMSFLNYRETRPWAKAIREAVLTRKMPPWFADPHSGKFLNDRSLSQREIDTLVAWTNTGALEGDPKDAPAPIEFAEGWQIGKPDQVIEMPVDFAVPASGTIEYQYIVTPTGFTEDKWVQSAEARPGARAVTHHMIAFVREPGSKWLRDAQPGVPFVPKKSERSRQRAARADADDSAPNAELLAGYAPGLPAMILRPGQAKLVKAGSDIVFQMHYTANGKATVDRSRVGMIFAKMPPAERVFTANATNAKFVIPPGDPNYEVKSEITFQDETRLNDLMPHMHLRGKDFEYRLVYPTGESETILLVPKYDFNWQLFYYLAEPKLVPKGTRMECTAHFDNSPNNPANPDPKSEVRWGDQSWEEMMIGWFDITLPAGRNPMDVLRANKQGRRTD